MKNRRMKKASIGLLSILSLAFTQQVQAQQVFIAPEVGGILGHINTKIVHSDFISDINAKAKLSYQGGIGVQIFVSADWAVQTGIYYRRYHYDNTFFDPYFPQNPSSPNTPVAFPFIYTLHYGEVPLSIAYYRNIGNAGSLFASLGGYIANAFAGQRSYPDGSQVQKFNFDDELLYDFRAMDVGLSAYIGYLSPYGIFARLGYTRGLTNLSPNADYEYRSESFSLMIGYRFRITTRNEQGQKW